MINVFRHSDPALAGEESHFVILSAEKDLARMAGNRANARDSSVASLPQNDRTLFHVKPR